VDRVDAVVDDIFRSIDAWRLRPGVDDIMMFHNSPDGPHTYSPRTTRLSPVDPQWLAQLARRQWTSRSLPTYTMPFDDLLSSLLRSYILVTIYRGIANSVAAENTSRLQAMQAAESNIGELLRELSMSYQLERQNTITAEVLDIVSGFEALMGN
jgi:F-type H+-transporting ATPase subunit gamma